MVEPSEVVNLVLAVGALPVLISAGRRQGMDGPRKAFLWGYLFMLGGFVATIAEGLVLHDVFNLAEHFAYAAAGVAFLVAVMRLSAAAPWERSAS